MTPSSPDTITEKAAAAALGCSVRTLQRHRADRSGPAYTLVHKRWIRYSIADLLRWKERSSVRVETAA